MTIVGDGTIFAAVRRVEVGRRSQRHRLAALLGLLGAGTGVLAGVTQASVGSRIPDWTGAKSAPGALGLLTIALSLVAGLAAVRQTRPGLSAGPRAATALVLIVPGLLCFTTVGRLWYVPGALLVFASLVSVESWRITAILIAANWTRCLLAALGAAELLMAAGAPAALMVVGAIGGMCLIAAARLTTLPKEAFVGLVMVGTVPFAVLAWTAIVPVLLLLVAVGLAVPLVRPLRRDHHVEAAASKGRS